VAELVQRHEQVRRQLIDIGAAIGSLIGDDGAAGPARMAASADDTADDTVDDTADDTVDDTNSTPTATRPGSQPAGH
jgi:hypothetical protein